MEQTTNIRQFLSRLPLVALLLGGCAHSSHTDAGWFSPVEANPAPYQGIRLASSRYLAMPDGVKIAVDIYLPVGLEAGETLPTIVRQTRYMRSLQFRWFWRLFAGDLPFDHESMYADRRELFVRQGYAWVDVDTRGSGASFGSRAGPFSADEIRDGAVVIDWIVEQPWSNGSVGATGISYAGSTAEFLLVNNHPAVKAVMPRFALFDVYTDIAFPGGIHAVAHTSEWQRINEALDRGALSDVAGLWVDWVFTGAQPVDEDPDLSMRSEAILSHKKNIDVHAALLEVTYRDDSLALASAKEDTTLSVDLFSPHNYTAAIKASGASIYGYSGWFDGAYAHSAIRRFLSVRTNGSRLILGPWSHGGGWHITADGPFASTFDHDGEMLRFFNHHLKGEITGIESEKPVHYFTMVEETWKASESWPPEGITPKTYYFEKDGALTTDEPVVLEAADIYRVNYTAGTGAQSRWKQTKPDAPVRYNDRAQQDQKLQTYTSAPLACDTEVTGHPVVTLFVSSSATDGNFFVYLEDIDARGRINYVTEGQLRALHRKQSSEGRSEYGIPTRSFKRADAMPLVPGQVAALVFDLLPTSYVFRKGHKLRIAVAGADSSHFAIIPSATPVTLRLHRDASHASNVELPIASRVCL